MPESLSSVRLLETYNPYPDCVSMELTAIPQPSESRDSQSFALFLTINFNEQWKSLLNGHIKFALKGADLKIRLENSEITLTQPELEDGYQINTTAKTHPAWWFPLKPGDACLKTIISQLQLGIVTPSAKSWYLAATLEVSLADITIIDAEGLWRHDISPNKHGILERSIARFLLEKRFKPCFSGVQLASKDWDAWQRWADKREDGINAEALFWLHNLIDSIYSAPTDDFLELAHLAGLNPTEDLAGGNLMAAELSGISFSGAILYQTNFRGANLTDADFSEANLSQAKFSGADLSGAYLGNANLRYADLHRAGLALANLIGADLTGANLQEVNLINANLSGATVTEAKFGNNSGLSEEMQQSLQQRGAIFL